MGDTFQVTGSGGASPVICGSNDGQHMIVDTDGAMCVTAAFSFGLDTATRNYRIHAIQYDRLNEMGGPAGCLQFFTGATGTVNTFNWKTVTTSTHLANQDYDVCIRRMADRCTICWSPIIKGQTAATTARGTFGLSNGATAAAITPMASLGTQCVADSTICSRVTPFKISVFTDGAEAVKGTAALKMSKDNEASAGVASTPTGTMGFSLGFSQIAC